MSRRRRGLVVAMPGCEAPSTGVSSAIYRGIKRHLPGMNFRLTGYEPPSTVLVVAMPGYEAPSNGHEFSVDGL